LGSGEDLNEFLKNVDEYSIHCSRVGVRMLKGCGEGFQSTPQGRIEDEVA